MRKVTTCLWFDHQAEEAANHYVSLFKDAAILEIGRYGESGPGPAGSVLTVVLRLGGHEIMLLNGGPHFKLTEAASLVVHCDSQTEIDFFWQKLSEGGEESRCGWLKDRYGVSWQIVPAQIGEWMSADHPDKAERVMQAALQMDKLDMAVLQRAYDGR